MARTDALLDYATIKAPFEGIVTDRFVDPGAMIQTSASSSGAPIVTLMNMDTVRVFIDVPEPDVRFVTRQTAVRLSVEALPGREFSGIVGRYSTALDPKTRTMKTEIDYPNADHALRPGMYGAAALELEKREGALTLPATTLLVEKDVAFVYVVVDGRAKRSPVRTGLNDGIVVEILEGLTGGESVIVAGKGTVTEGTPVRTGSQR
jgi:RND family efflux transporter MFP subunit